MVNELKKSCYEPVGKKLLEQYMFLITFLRSTKESGDKQINTRKTTVK